MWTILCQHWDFLALALLLGLHVALAVVFAVSLALVFFPGHPF